MQVSLLSKKGIKACGVYGGQDDEQVQKDVLKGEYRLVYFTPETIIGVKKWRNMLLNEVYSSRLRTFIIDEAHTVVHGEFTIFCSKLAFLRPYQD